MKNATFKRCGIFLIGLLFAISATAQSDTILIDFGSSLTNAPWNNLSDGSGGGSIDYLMNSRNKLTPMGLVVYDPFNGINTGGTTTPDAALDLPSTATSDSYFGNVGSFGGKIEPTGGIQLNGLNPAVSYTFEIFASRMSVSDSRETKFRFRGLTVDSVYVEPSNNASTIATITMVPKADGTMLLEVSPGENNTNGTGFYYLGSIKMIYTDASAVLDPGLALISPNGGEDWQAGSLQYITWEGINLSDMVELSYTTDNGSSWESIATVDSTAQSYLWTVPSMNIAEAKVAVASGALRDESDASFAVTGGSLPDMDTIYIDFGSDVNETGGSWNNLSRVTGDGAIEYLQNQNSLLTGISVNVYDRFNGVNTNGTTNPDLTLRLPGTATADNYYGNVAVWANLEEPTAAMIFEGLTPGKEYSFELFASRMSVSDNRETKYTFTGEVKDSVYLDPGNNESTFAEITVIANAQGMIDLLVQPGENNNNSYGFYYLGALRMFYLPEDPLPATLEILQPNGGEEWIGGETAVIEWTGINLEDSIRISFSADNGITWELVGKVDSLTREYIWTLPVVGSEEYLVKVEAASAMDESNGVFTIIDPTAPMLMLKAPVAGDTWIQNDTRPIKWKAANLTSDISVELSTDNGGTWSSLGTATADAQSFNWTIASAPAAECILRVSSGDMNDESGVFSLVEEECTNTIVVLGSSTAYGSGANPIDSSWVNLYSDYLEDINEDYHVVNLALGGYTSFQILPDGTPISSEYTETIDTERNVTKALTYNPYAIIINMPSNDATKWYDVEAQMENYRTTINTANAEGIRVWIATTQPRNFADTLQVQLQEDVRDAILYKYDQYAIDFWSDIAGSDGHILTAYDSGDGVHLNNAGHRVLFNQVVAKSIDTLACVEPIGVVTLPVEQKITVFPNPVSDLFYMNLETGSRAEVHVSFLDYTGRKVGQEQVELAGAGMHTMQFSTDKLNTSGSVIVAIVRVEEEQEVYQHVIKLLKTE